MGGLDDREYLGNSLAFLGDLNEDGVTDLVAGASGDDGGTNRGAIWVLFLAGPPVVSIPDTVATYDELLKIPVQVSVTTGLGIVSAEVFVSYDGDILTALSSGTSGTLLGPGWSVETHIVEGIGTNIDTIKMAMATDDEVLTGAGTLVNIHFQVADIRHPAYSPLTLEHVLFNDGTPDNTKEGGSVTLIGVNGTIVSLPSEIIPRWSIGVSVSDRDEDRTGTRDAFSVQVINGSESEILPVFETGNTTGVFSGTIGTVFSLSASPGDGLVQAKAGDQIVFTYTDLLDGNGDTIERTDITNVTGGADGALRATVVSQPGDTVRIKVTDSDLSETVSVSVENPRTGEAESILLSVFSPGSSIFYGRVFTNRGAAAGNGNDSTLNVLKADVLEITYADTLTALGGTATVPDEDEVVDPFGDTMLPPIPPFNGKPADGTSGAIDAFAVLYHRLYPYIVGIDSLSANVDVQAPFSEITPFDASLILQKRVGLIDRFPVQTPASDNHPQPETEQLPNPKLLPEERLLTLVPGDGYVALWMEDRSGIVSGELVVEGAEGEIEMGPELGSFLSASRQTEKGLQIVFAGPAPINGPGELLRVYRVGPEPMQLAQAQFNDGWIGGRLASPEILPSAQPLVFALHANVPNPFNPETTIFFDLPQKNIVRLEVFNILGQRVRTLVHGPREAGYYQATWEGKDEHGRELSSGIYIYRLTSGGFVESRRMVLLR